MELAEYRSKKHLKQSDVCNAVRMQHPKFTKIQASMAENQAYGLCLRKSAEQALYLEYGELEVKKKADRHRNPSRVSCRMQKVEIRAFRKAVARYGHTAQGLIYQLVSDWMERNAPEDWANAKKIACMDSSHTDDQQE